MAADTKARVEDIYLPYKPKRRTKAQIAREAGLEPLADRLLADPTLVPDDAAAGFVSEHGASADAAAALEGARHIIAERAAENAELVGASAGTVLGEGAVRTSRVFEGGRRPVRRPRSFATTSTSPSRWRPCRRTACWPCCAARRSRCSRSTSTAAKTTLYLAMVARRAGRRSDRSGRRDAVAGDHRRLRVAGQAIGLGVGRRPHPAAATRREGRRGGVRHEPQGPAARGAGRYPHDARPRSRLPDRCQGRRRRRHRQGGRHLRDLPASAAAAVGRGQGDAGGAGRPPRRRADRGRKRHRVARDRRAGCRTHRRHPRGRCGCPRRPW